MRSSTIFSSTTCARRPLTSPRLLSLALLRWSGVLAALALLGMGAAWGQGVVEYGGASAKASTSATAAKRVGSATAQAPQAQNPNFLHIPARTGEAPDVANRRVLEERAGKDGGKLVLRSVPIPAQAWVAGKFVGATPVQLTLAPGSYTVEMRGGRMESARQKVDVLPKETREVIITLTPRYPSQVRLR